MACGAMRANRMDGGAWRAGRYDGGVGAARELSLYLYIIITLPMIYDMIEYLYDISYEIESDSTYLT